MPQRKSYASDVSRSNDVDRDINGISVAKNEKLSSNSGVSVDTLVANASAVKEEILPCERSKCLGLSENLDGESTMNSVNDNNDSLADESSSQETNSTNSATGFLRSCTTECRACRPPSGENRECRDANQDNLKDSDPNKENDQCRTTGEDGCVSEEKGIKATPACHFKDVVAIVDPPRVGLHSTVSNIFLCILLLFWLLPFFIMKHRVVIFPVQHQAMLIWSMDTFLLDFSCQLSASCISVL